MSEDVTLKTGNLKEEMVRKGIHLGTGILMAALYSFLESNVLVFLHLLFLVAIWLLEILRFKGAILVPFLRDWEKKNIGAHAFFMLSTFISILVFDMRIAIASILMLTIGDAASGAVQLFNRSHRSSLEGHKAWIKPPGVIFIMFIASFVVGYLSLHSITVALFGAIGAAMADGLQLKVRDIIIDDNLTIPLYAGLLMSLVSLW